MSKNHLVKKNKIEKKPKKQINKPKKKYWKYKTIPNKKIKIANEVNKGQGLLGTIWKGVFWDFNNRFKLNWFVFKELKLILEFIIFRLYKTW